VSRVERSTVPFLSSEATPVAQAVATRDGAKAGWRWLPRLRVRVNPIKAGVCLALSAWLLQAYTGALLDSRDRLERSIQMADNQRQIWLIEYNSSLVRTPRNSRVTARAAYQVTKNTHEVLALSNIAQGGLFVRKGTILAELRKKQDWTRELFDARDYGQLVAELDTVGELFEARTREHTIGIPQESGILNWVQLSLPAVFLFGMFLCWKGRRGSIED
jgi:hypothetical protein